MTKYPASERVVDVHQVFTTLFNVELNEFIAKFDRRKIFEVIHTGGLMEIKSGEHHQFYVYTQWLYDFREELYHKTSYFKMSYDLFKKEIVPLLEFYVHVRLLAEYPVFSKEAQRELEEYFLKPFMRFISKLDRTLESNFAKVINSLIERSLGVTIRVVNAFNIPVSDVDVQISYVRFPAFQEHAKAYPLCTLKTDRNGNARLKLLLPSEGGFRIDVKKYHKTEFLDIKTRQYLEIKVFDILKLLKQATLNLVRKKEKHQKL